MEATFKDHFSSVAKGYASYRPTYPATLFKWLATLPAQRTLALDCACGNGQATLGLAPHFQRVIGTDASVAQIQAAPTDQKNIDWMVAAAHQTGLQNETVHLITVAQAMHWLDLPRFYKEVNRVLRPGGVIAIWCYGINEVEGVSINDIAQDYYSNIVGPYWPPERVHIEQGYRTLDFPFKELSVPQFEMETVWTLEQLLGYFSTWSATSRYIAARKENPIEPLRTRLAREWGPPEKPRRITWPLSVRAGRKT